MINTDKYEKTNWDLRGQFTHTEMADEVLLLLAEVKWWYKVRDYILEKASYPTVKKLHLKDLLNFMEEGME